jgi:predicted short-subunit dehydrogenase-like oxidoreductase (DUF2520 family)
MGEAAPERVVVILGAGRVATHLVPALFRAGYRIAQIYSRTIDAARTLADPLGVSYTDSLDSISSEAHIYIACVADEALPMVASRVAHNGGDKIFLHTAGSVAMDVWRDAGAEHYGILYPLQTFSKEREVDMREVSLFVEASDEATLHATEQLAKSLSDKVYRADSALRAQLHIAAVFACNFTNAMYGIAHHLLSKGGIPFDVLLPLVDETAAKVHTLAPSEAQTGPAIRGDHAVMKRHIEALENTPELQSLYERISALIARK